MNSPSSSSSEQVFSHELARRSVARAALHLGIDGLSEEALNVLADVLLEYLSRVGASLSKLVESSGRTSQHVNVLDALHAIQMTSAPTTQQLSLSQAIAADATTEEEEGQGETQEQQQQQEVATPQAPPVPFSNNWQDLAVFLFGPNWNQKVPSGGAMGKIGPSATASGSGWEAPYLEEVPHYPLASPACANPHPLGPHEGWSLHNDDEDSDQQQLEAAKAVQQELANMPDAAFLEWGQLRGADTVATETKSAAGATMAVDTKRKREDDEEPSLKRARLDADAVIKSKETKIEATAALAPRRPAYLASFMPDFPSVGTKRVLTVGGAKAATTTATTSAAATKPSSATTADTITSSTTMTPAAAAGTTSVRDSLVQMHGFYWGSGWDNDKAAPRVLPGRAATEAPADKMPTATVVPLGRASGSRVSRILEGSMDLMQ
jgi:hypothetical protein